jgi:quinol monooxygenase YgiN
VAITFSAVVPRELHPLEVTSLTEYAQVPPISEGELKGKGQVHATIRVLISPKQRKEALMILGSIIEQTKIEEGCISCRLYQDVHQEGALMLQQLWSNEMDLHRHLRSDKFHTVLLVIEMATEPPEIRFESVAQSAGMEVIEKART